MRMIFQIGKKTVHVGIELSSMKLERIFVIVSLRLPFVFKIKRVAACYCGLTGKRWERACREAAKRPFLMLLFTQIKSILCSHGGAHFYYYHGGTT